MIATEKAFDMLPYASDLISKLDIKSYILANKDLLAAKDKGDAEKAMNDKGFDFLMYILKNSAKVKEEVFNLLAIVQDKTVDEIKRQPFATTISQFKDLLQDNELLSFFKFAMR
jgi:hypothetical protein